MNIPFLDLRPGEFLRQELDDAHARVMESGRFIGCEEVEKFEENWARYIGAKYCVACGNGFDALYMSLMSQGVGKQHRVAVSPITCLPTWAAVEMTGALIIAPEDETNLNVIAPDVIVPVHIYGIPVEVNAPSSILVVEDACQAHGSRYNDNEKVGSRNITAWSFYPTKNLGCYGDAGAITTNDKHTADYLRQFREYGGNLSRSGINSRMDTLQAAYLNVKLPYLDYYNARRAEIAKAYTEGINWSDCIQRFAPIGMDDSLCNWHQFVVYCSDRDYLRGYLASHGVETKIHYDSPPHLRQCFSYYKTRCASATEWSKSVLSLPIYPGLADEHVEYIISKINEWVEKCQ